MAVHTPVLCSDRIEKERGMRKGGKGERGKEGPQRERGRVVGFCLCVCTCLVERFSSRLYGFFPEALHSLLVHVARYTCTCS